MGGKLFNGRRVERKEFLELEDEVVKFLQSNLLSNKIRKLLHVSDKTSFGDIDLIVSNTLTESCISFLERSGINYKKNGDTLSFLWRGVQVDLIFVKPELLDFSVKYFSHGDKSNLIGKLVKSHYGITFSSLGPYYKFNFDSGAYVYKQFLENNETIDYDVLVFKLLGLTPNSSYTEEELFEWIYSSPFFHKSIYRLEELNSEQRKRDKDRPFYQRWLAWLDTKEDKCFTFDDEFVFLNKLSVYPDFTKYEQFHYRQYKLKLREKQSFSGHRISYSLSEGNKLEGKTLGDFIRFLKEKYYYTILELDLNNVQEYSDTINSLYEKYKGSYV